ncbi:MAG: cyclase family protein [Deltaproteobacteria bacterium]|nr:cyclase family protein [Deltaproteobacteria bacterium]MBW2121500.1 cyclase family protein [Deltaproteobacteria bacterium]
MLIEFSYSLDPKEIVMPGDIAPPEVRPRSRMVQGPAPGEEGRGVRWGSYNNTSIVEFFVHTGTHIDVPFHVSPEALKLEDFEISDFVFDKPLLLEIPKGDMERISVEDLKPSEARLAESDLLLVYTGFSEVRKTDPKRYVAGQPSFSVDAAHYLVDNFNLRGVGVDLIGIENIPEAKGLSPQFPVHKTFLLKKKRRFLLVEDANLAPLVGRTISRAYVIPLRLFGLEAMPVTAFADVED